MHFGVFPTKGICELYQVKAAGLLLSAVIWRSRLLRCLSTKGEMRKPSLVSSELDLTEASLAERKRGIGEARGCWLGEELGY